MGSSKTITFTHAGYYFLGLILLALVGFWPSYFSKLFDPAGDLHFYFHFHALIAALWISVVIIQPILIHKKNLNLHRKIGKLSYVLFTMIFISVLLLVHHQHSPDESNLGNRVFVPFKDLIILGVAYYLAIRYRKKIPVHARAMIATGLVFIEPALIRAMRNYIDPPGHPYLWTIFTVYILLLVLIFLERKQKQGRWVFPLILVLYLIVHSVIIFKPPLGFFDTVARWFIGLPLT